MKDCGMQISVRTATADDYSSICQLFDELDALHFEHLPHIFQRPDGPARDRDYFWGLIADETVALLVAEAGAELVGFVHAFVRQAPDFPIVVPRRYAVVDAVVVRAGLQGNGIGRRLMDAAQAWAIAQGATSIELNVYEFNETAISFYESLGYETFSRKMSKQLNTGKAAG